MKKLGEGQFGEVLLMIACVSETCRECTREHECAFVHMCRLCAYNMNIVSLGIHELVAKFTYEQYATVNQQLQDVLTRGSLSTAYKCSLVSS